LKLEKVNEFFNDIKNASNKDRWSRRFFNRVVGALRLSRCALMTMEARFGNRSEATAKGLERACGMYRGARLVTTRK